MTKKEVIKYLKNLKQREQKKGNYWDTNAQYIENCIKVLEDK